MEPYFILLLGAVILIVALLTPSVQKKLKLEGKKAEGVIFDMNGETDPADNTLIAINDRGCARVRFVTEQLEWITENVDSGKGFSWNRNFSPGDKVTVYYDPDNPRNFFVDTGVPETVIRTGFALAGLGLLLAGLYQLLTASYQ